MQTTVQEVLDSKGGAELFTISPNDTVQSAVEIMASERISALPVMQGSALVGIISERDYIRKAAPQRRVPWEISVSELMTSEVICVAPQEPVENCLRTMTSKKIRHLPVVREGTLVGIVSISDLIVARRRASGR